LLSNQVAYLITFIDVSQIGEEMAIVEGCSVDTYVKP